MAENFLNRLARNPYAPIDAASVTRIDEMGNGSDGYAKKLGSARLSEAELIKRRSVLICCHGRRSRHVSSSRHVAHKPVSLRGAAPHRTHVPSSGRALSTSLIMTFVAASASATVAQVKARTAE